MKYLASVLLLLVPTTLTAQDIYIGGGWGGIYDTRPFITFDFQVNITDGPWLAAIGTDLLRGSSGDRGEYRLIPAYPGEPFDRCVHKETGEEAPLRKCSLTGQGWDYTASVTRHVVGDLRMGLGVHRNMATDKLVAVLATALRREAKEGAIAIAFNLDLAFWPFYLNAGYMFTLRL